MQALGEESMLLMCRQQSLLMLMRCMLQGAAKCAQQAIHTRHWLVCWSDASEFEAGVPNSLL